MAHTGWNLYDDLYSSDNFSEDEFLGEVMQDELAINAAKQDLPDLGTAFDGLSDLDGWEEDY